MAKKTTKNNFARNVHKNNKSMREELVKNGISEAIMGFEPGGIGVQLSQADTLFKNNRWYLVSNMRQLLSEIYVEHGLVQTICQVPVDDGLRGGVKIKSKQLDEDQIQLIQSDMDRNNDLGTMGQAMIWNRLFGGAGVVIMTGQDPATPLNWKALKEGQPFEFRAVDMWELFASLMNTSDIGAAIDGSQINEAEYYDYYGVRLHHSRVIKLKGVEAPSFVRPRLRGWGCSVVETLVRSVNQYLKTNNLIFEVLDEFKVDYYKLKNLASTLLTPDGENAVRRRVDMTNRQKNYQNAVVMDGEDDFGSKELSFAGIAEVMVGIKQHVASDMRMPLTKIFGISAAGFSSGEDDIENYNAMVESSIRTKCKYDILKMIELRCQIRFGFVPDDLDLEFKPLRVLGAEAQENVKTQVFNRLLQAKTAGEISSKEFKEGCNVDNLLPIKLDPNQENLLSGASGNVADEGIEGVKALKSTLVAKDAPEVKNSLESQPHITAVALICDGYVLTGRRRDNNLWTFPGGHMDGGESVEQCACRETYEEVGIAIEPSDLKKVATKNFTSHRAKGKKFTVTGYVAELPERIQPLTSEDPDSEFSVVRWVKINPNANELLPENRHAKEDLVLDHVLKKYQAQD